MSEITAELLAQANAEIYLKWTSEARLYCTKILYQEGQSASQIANKIGGVSRNAVIGIIHRKGWVVDRRQTRLRSPRKPKAPRVPKAQPKQPPSAKVFMFGKNMPNFGGEPYDFKPADIVIPEGQSKTIIELENHHCRFPLGEAMEVSTHFCGGDKVPGLPYCLGHCRISFQPPQSRSRTAITATQSVTGRQNVFRGGEASQQKETASGELVGAK